MANRKPRVRQDETEDFYEVIPMTASPHYVFSDDAWPNDEVTSVHPDDNGRAYALVTIALVGLLALAAGFLYVRSLQMLQTALPTQAQADQPRTVA